VEVPPNLALLLLRIPRVNLRMVSHLSNVLKVLGVLGVRL